MATVSKIWPSKMPKDREDQTVALKMSSTVTIDEKQLIHVIHEYLEQTGRIECVVALEKDLNDDLKPRVPADLAFLRSLCLNGRWEDVVECVKVFERCEQSQGCLCAVHKQWYLETLSTKQSGVQGSEQARVELLSDLLAKLKELCSLEQDYSALCSLLDQPSLRASPDYSTWSLYPARLKVFHTIGRWMSKFIYPDLDPLTIFKEEQTDPLSAKLVQLVAKGLMYEKCEAIALSRCQGEKRGEGSTMFDLSGWMQQQPDSAFQIPPSSCQLTFNPQNLVSAPDPSQPVEKMVTEHGARVKQNETLNSIQTGPHSSASNTQHTPQPATSGSREEEKGSHDPSSPPIDAVTSRHTDSVPASSKDNIVVTEVDAGSVDTVPEPSAATDQRTAVKDVVSSSKPSKTKLAESVTRSGSSHTPTAEPASERVPTPHKSSSIRVRESHSSQSKIRVLEEFEDNFISSTPPSARLLPQHKTGRDSSTPKPSSNKLHLQPSPPTSPVGRATSPVGGDTPQLQRGDGADGRGPPPVEPRRHFDFSECTEEVSIEWPTVTMLSQVKDAQAVRSVAFSQSGRVVAVGANSRTLRLCSTTALLEGRVSEELPVFYHHASYHKGSIYCLAWSGDTLLASGSNDHKLRLLAYDSTSESPCRPLGELNIHAGTIRDVAFTPGGLLVSGGAVDTGVKVSDVTSRQVVASLAGHTEQVLGVDVLEENLIVSGSQDKTVKLWDLRQCGPVWSVECVHPVNSLSVSPLGNEVVTSHSDGSCSVHTLSTASTQVTYHPHTDDCRSVRWSPGAGQWILSGSYDGTVCVCERGGVEWQQVGGHSDKVVQVRWHCGGSVFATTGADKRACFWAFK